MEGDNQERICVKVKDRSFSKINRIVPQPMALGKHNPHSHNEFQRGGKP
jgi:hypothetical protein